MVEKMCRDCDELIRLRKRVQTVNEKNITLRVSVSPTQTARCGKLTVPRLGPHQLPP